LEHIGLSPLPAQVPGNVELDLVRAGLLQDPFIGANIHQIRLYEGCEYWYTRSFTLPAEPACRDWNLTFEGLDLLAEIWVNGQKVGGAANMLVPHQFSVSGALRWGAENTIAVRLSSAINFARRQQYDPHEMSWEQRWEGLRLRKAPHVWGWDILPRAVSAGIWRSVHLDPVEPEGFEWIYYWTRDANPQMAVLGVRFQVRIPGSLDDLRLHFSGVCQDHRFEQDWPLEFTAGGCSIPVPQPRLWWPKGYGQANLYTITTRLYRGKILLAERSDQVGLRAIQVQTTPTAGPAVERDALSVSPSRWDNEPDPDHHFVVKVNNVPVMVKAPIGFPWMPFTAAMSHASPAR